MPVKQDVLLLIMNCEKYTNKAQYQINGWLQEIDIPYFHVIGKEDLETPYLFANRTLYVRTKDDYISLPHKVIEAYAAVHAEYDYQYIFKTDDDQFLTFPIFLKILAENLLAQKNKIHYGGKIVNVIKDHISIYWQFHPELPKDVLVKKSVYCNGRFYFLSYEAVNSLMSQRNNIKNEYFEDYAIGLYMEPEYKFPIYEIPNDVFVDFA